MNEQQEQKHARNKRILKIVGFAILIVGLGLAVTGIASFFSSFGSGEMPDLFWMCFVGFPLLPVGGFLLALGFRREMTQYIKNEGMPVFNEAAQEAQPGISATASAARQGFAESVPCPRCGAANDRDAKFCKECGAPLRRVCPACGNEVSADAKFCDGCGKPL